MIDVDALVTWWTRTLAGRSIKNPLVAWEMYQDATQLDLESQHSAEAIIGFLSGVSKDQACIATFVAKKSALVSGRSVLTASPSVPEGQP